VKQFILCAAGCAPLTTALRVRSKLAAVEVYAVTLWRIVRLYTYPIHTGDGRYTYSPGGVGVHAVTSRHSSL